LRERGRGPTSGINELASLSAVPGEMEAVGMPDAVIVGGVVGIAV
jgi:hypothetical protein